MESERDSWEKVEAEIISCRKCPRLVAWREKVAQEKRRAYQDQIYWGKPVPGFGDHHGRVLVVGLAPGAHGANRTGRMFTGDGSGVFLYKSLFQAGFTNQPTGISRDDGLELRDMFISAVCRCAPPDNQPKPSEITNCLPFLKREMNLISPITVIVALGRIAFEESLRLLRQSYPTVSRYEFKHAAGYWVGENQLYLIASYHPSLQNTQTGRLTEAMFAKIWTMVRAQLIR